MFGMHRYYRSRNLSNALTWFCSVSTFSFVNIWISYGLQDFVTQHGTTKSIQTAARNEYHVNAYKSYIERAQQQTETIDRNLQPVMRNSQSESMDLFIEDFEVKLKNHFGITS